MSGGAPDPSGEQRAQEQQRQARIAKSMKSIDQTFTGGPAHKMGVNLHSGAATPGGTYYDADGNPITIPDTGGGRIGKALAAVMPTELYEGTTDVPATKGFDNDYYSGIADKFMQFQQPLFDEQVATARRELPYQFSSTGNSEYIRKMGELERDVTRQGADLKDQALGFANNQRAEVERNRSDLVSMANAGTDASAVAQMAAGRSAALAKPPPFSPIADLFQKYTAGFANNAIAQNQGNPMVRQTPLLFGSSGRSSVRSVG